MKHLWAPWRMKFINDTKKKDPKDNECIFCTLPNQNQDRDNLILYQGSLAFVIMNKYPYSSGHLMVIPYEHTASFESLSSECLLEMQKLMQRIMKMISAEMKPQGFNIGMNIGAAGGAGIPGHLHYHLVPRWLGDTNFMPAIGETKVMPESLEATYARLAKHF